MNPSSNDGDYEYDQAHELANDQMPASRPHRPHQPPPSSTMPAVEPDGDYSYDQAHDVGGGR
jgi:hypothetical protein